MDTNGGQTNGVAVSHTLDPSDKSKSDNSQTCPVQSDKWKIENHTKNSATSGKSTSEKILKCSESGDKFEATDDSVQSEKKEEKDDESKKSVIKQRHGSVSSVGSSSYCSSPSRDLNSLPTPRHLLRFSAAVQRERELECASQVSFLTNSTPSCTPSSIRRKDLQSSTEKQIVTLVTAKYESLPLGLSQDIPDVRL